MNNKHILSHTELLQLKRWNTPTLYNGWEQITSNDRTDGFTNREETKDFMPQMGPMIGYAMTVVIQPGNPDHSTSNPNAWNEYREYLASLPGPKIVVAQDLDKPEVIGSFWGEVNANICRTLGCVGTITDGAVRDLDEMTNAGIKALAKRLCVGHAYSHPVRWNCEVEVFGNQVKPGQLIHADKHGFMIIPEEDQAQLLDASIFMDKNECDTLIAAARAAEGLTMKETLKSIRQANKAFNQAAEDKFGRKGEW
ncbi:MAG: RraA family protein [Opitutae bacterium]|nr:RraA family protein [Opitutae bacterium]MBT4225636.1 RraA family protein [Opitutae bacterium]MBT5379715.1 RraA family protein [Opitutae bacterium]MBT5690620.1 RraA family protein [Opitutae bacterium]MBT6462974.1 RraA family protein [Opitutae bacterium]